MDGCDRSVDAIAIAMGSRTHTRSIDIDIDRPSRSRSMRETIRSRDATPRDGDKNTPPTHTDSHILTHTTIYTPHIKKPHPRSSARPNTRRDRCDPPPKIPSIGPRSIRQSRPRKHPRPRDPIVRSIASIHPSTHRSSSPSSYLHTAHFLENVCPPRVLLRLPRRRLQGDQDPSTYCRVSRVAWSRIASHRITRHHALAWSRDDDAMMTMPMMIVAHRRPRVSRDTIVACGCADDAATSHRGRRAVRMRGGNFMSFAFAFAFARAIRSRARVARAWSSARACGRSYRAWIARTRISGG